MRLSSAILPHLQQVCGGESLAQKEDALTSVLFCYQNLLADLDEIRARLNCTGGDDLDVLVIIRVRHDRDDNGGVAGGCDLRQIHLQQQVALLDFIANLDLRAEAIALHLDGIHADVDQNLDAAVSQNAQRVATVRCLRDLAVRRGKYLALGGVCLLYTSRCV